MSDAGSCGRRSPSGPARRSRTRSCRKRSRSPPPSSSTSARRPSRASREGEALRDRARAIKEATLQHLDVHLERLADNVERLGGHVHWADHRRRRRARSSSRLCRDKGVRMAVKSKSMATEEIDLNEALERGGRHAGRDRPGRVHHPARPREARRTSSRPPSTRPRGRWPSCSRAELGGQLRGRSRGADRGGAQGRCARSSSRPTWASPAPTSPWPRPAPWCSSPTRATGAW